MTTDPLLCVTVTAPTTAALREARDRVTGADLIELRLDTVSDPDVAGALAGRLGPVIVTCRAAWEGGAFKGSEEERRQLLTDAIEQGADYVDIEWRAGFDDLVARNAGRGIVLSAHDFEKMPVDVAEQARAMRTTGAEVIKIAARANRLCDCLPLLDVDAVQGPMGRAVLIAMGESGLATRVLPGRFGSAWTYAGNVRDVGQVTADGLLGDYRFRSLRASTGIYGLVGSPIAHSVSPAMHNAAFAAAGYDAVYLPLPPADADDFLTFAHAMGLEGASVTIPFKVAMFERVKHVNGDAAERIGALNTLRREGDTWLGRNTDALGFLEPLDAHGVSLDNRRVSVLGAGGSARAVVIALESRAAVVTVHARDPRRADQVASIGAATVGDWPPAPGSWDLLVNCTPIGMYPGVDETPVPVSHLRSGLVYDLIYNPRQTRLLREAAAAGCQTISGLDMLVAQASEQFRWWTGMPPPPGVMHAAAVKRLSEFSSNENHVV